MPASRPFPEYAADAGAVPSVRDGVAVVREANAPERPPTTLEGSLECITFANEEAAWSVVRVTVPGRKEPITAVGNLSILEKKDRHMKNPRYSLSLGLASLIGVLVSGCASGGRPLVEQPLVEHPTKKESTAQQPTYLAQSAVNNCLPRDSSMVCCIKKFPLTPMESCGATAVEVAEVLNGVKVLNEAAQAEAAENAADTAGAEEDDEAHNAHLPEWKRECIRGYKNCQEFGWTGSCYDCLRYCEGQHAWPTATCGPPKRKHR